MNYGAAVATISALVLSVFAAATPAFAWGGHNGGSNSTDNSVVITVSNKAEVVNTTSAKASTGGNWAGGSEGGDGEEAGNGGNGGDAEGAGKGDNNGGVGGEGGNGGNGGNGGAGGLITTGNAEANAGTMNTVNTTDIEVEQADCGCAQTSGKKHKRGNRTTVDNTVEVGVSNSGGVTNTTDAYAKTGYNDAEGSEGGDGDDAGNGGNGGNAEEGSSYNRGSRGHGYGHGSNKGGGDNNGGAAGNGGNGGNGGDGNVGGTIVTGHALSNAGTVNVLNTTLIRVRR